MTKGPVTLLILDGWGVREEKEGNALASARLPNYRRLASTCPYTVLEASGEAVGLPPGQMGNSEVGHLNIGAGRVVYQELPRISRSIQEGDFFANRALLEAVRAAGRPGQALHLLGLVSPGGVHSHEEHLYALLDLAARHRLERVFVHAFLDGRDTPPQSALTYLERLQQKFREFRTGRLATVMGRYYAMDRDRRWERTRRAYLALTAGEGERASDALEAVRRSYAREVNDEFVEPVILEEAGGQPVAAIRDGDGVIFFNFRADRARQLTRAFVEDDFSPFSRPGGKLALTFVCLTRYEEELELKVAFPPEPVLNTLGEVVAGRGFKQLRVAETEKYAHVTFFFNGGREEPNPGEERILVPSPKVPTYDLQPEMSAPEVTRRAAEGIASGQYRLVVVNLANPDMVGHTGILEAAVQAVEVVDGCLGVLEEAAGRAGGALLVTADHGNAEQMLDEQGKPQTAHTVEPVPLILVDPSLQGIRLRQGCSLRDIAPTVLELMGVEIPPEMTGKSLINSAVINFVWPQI